MPNTYVEMDASSDFTYPCMRLIVDSEHLYEKQNYIT